MNNKHSMDFSNPFCDMNGEAPWIFPFLKRVYIYITYLLSYFLLFFLKKEEEEDLDMNPNNQTQLNPLSKSTITPHLQLSPSLPMSFKEETTTKTESRSPAKITPFLMI